MKTKCRICGNPYEAFMDFGNMPLANGFIKEKDFDKEYFFHLAVGFCPNCLMVQLIEQPSPTSMFNERYPFFSSTSKFMDKHFKELADELSFPDCKVLEIGSNDGIMLKHFKNNGCKVVGIEPSRNVAEVAIKNGIDTIVDFFSYKSAAEINRKYGEMDVVVSANVMCHIPDLPTVFNNVGEILKYDGIFVFEDPYIVDVLKKVSYDQIYDEHVYLFSVSSVSRLARMNGFSVVDIKPQPTHGGSMRYYLRKGYNNTIEESVVDQLHYEMINDIQSLDTYELFANEVRASRTSLLELLYRLKEDKKKIVGYAAASKSTTILNFCGIGTDLIECIYDTTPEKQGLFSPGVHIPVISHRLFSNNYPDVSVLFAWNHVDEIMQKEINYLRSGGKFLVHTPTARVL